MIVLTWFEKMIRGIYGKGTLPDMVGDWYSDDIECGKLMHYEVS